MSGIASIFGGGSKSQPAAAAPKLEPVVRLPDREDPRAREEARMQRRKRESRGGRESTNLDRGSYVNDKLGQ